MEAVKVGIREFRTDLAGHIATGAPVAVTRHGQTVGYFIPAQGVQDADLAALKKAGQMLDKMLAARGVDVEGVLAEFKTARVTASKRKKVKAALA